MHQAFCIQGCVSRLPRKRIDPSGAGGRVPDEAVSVFIRDQGILPVQRGNCNLRSASGGFLFHIVFQRENHPVRYREAGCLQIHQSAGQLKVLRCGRPASENQHMPAGNPVQQSLPLFFGQGSRIHVIHDNHSECVQQFPLLRKGFRIKRHRLPVFIAQQRIVFLGDIQVRKVPRPGGKNADHHRGRIDNPFRRRVHRQQRFPVPEDFRRKGFLPRPGCHRQHNSPFTACGNENSGFKPVIFHFIGVGVHRHGPFQVFPGISHRHPHGYGFPVGNPSVISQKHLRFQGRILHFRVQSPGKSRPAPRKQAYNQYEGRKPSGYPTHKRPSCSGIAVLSHLCDP